MRPVTGLDMANYWEEEARRYAQNSDYHRTMYLKVRDELAALQQKTDELVVLFLTAHEGAKDSHNYWLHAANKIKTHFN
jgi:hypothetical protein